MKNKEKMKCPQCDKELETTEKTLRYKCSNLECDYVWDILKYHADVSSTEVKNGNIKPCKNEDCKWYGEIPSDPNEVVDTVRPLIYQRCLACSCFDRTESYYEKKCGEIGS